MASGHEQNVITSFIALRDRVAELPPSAATAAVREEMERLDAALRSTGHELGRPAWMKP